MIEEMIREEEQLVKSMEQYVLAKQRQGNYPSYFNFPLNIQFDLTDLCNLRCLHCFNDSGMGSEKAENMTDERWRALAEGIVGEGGVFEICFSGGEPLLKKDLLLELLDLFAKDGAALLIITNGYLLDENTALALAKFKRLRVRLSLDGYNAELHDSLRQVPGSFARAVQAARLMAQYGVAFEISSCVAPTNLAEIDRMADLAREVGAARIMFDSIGASGRAAQNKHLLLSQNQLEDFYSRLQNLRHKQDFVEQAYTGNVMVQMALSGIPRASLLIRPNGDVRMGCLAPFVIGNVLSEEIGEIWCQRGRDASKHPRVLEYLHNADVVWGGNKDFVNYLDRDMRLDFSSVTKKEELLQNHLPNYTPPSVVPYTGHVSYTDQPKPDLSLLSLKAKGTALKVREDGSYLLARSAQGLYIMNYPAHLAYLRMDGTRTGGEIAQEIATKYGCEPETVKLDLTGLFRKLTDYGLIKQ